ncbi:MAG: hypothetical protein JXA81_02940 [Sedimentisphaerales bacterium]|nr:hypothetical protein [Sedimentisphaerales bacterium]
MAVTRIKTRTDSNKITLPLIDDVQAEHWAKLAQKKIFFGHQSVGYNIIDGITDIVNERDYIKLNIVEAREPAAFDRPVFAHSQVGMNTEPFSKIERFVEIMDAGVGGKVDIAFFKFCYVDIMRDSDPREIFDGYSAAMEELTKRYPNTKFLHVTVPIRSVPKGAKRRLKQTVKLLIGRPGFVEDNMMRLNYNDLLNNANSKTGLFFDLAHVETVNSSGFRCYARKGAEKVSALAPEYTEDGGHLNNLGRKKVAEQLLIILAEIASRS